MTEAPRGEAAVSPVVTFSTWSPGLGKARLSLPQERGLGGKVQRQGEHSGGAPLWGCSSAMTPLLTLTHSPGGPSGCPEERGLWRELQRRAGSSRPEGQAPHWAPQPGCRLPPQNPLPRFASCTCVEPHKCPLPSCLEPSHMPFPLARMCPSRLADRSSTFTVSPAPLTLVAFPNVCPVPHQDSPAPPAPPSTGSATPQHCTPHIIYGNDSWECLASSHKLSKGRVRLMYLFILSCWPLQLLKCLPSE